MHYAEWQEALTEEVQFWRGRLSRVDNAIQHRLNIGQVPVPAYIRARIPADAADPIRILDVGAGPLTYLGAHWPERQVELVPIDVLADEYNRILGECGLVAPIPTRKASFEELPQVFAAASFDFVNAGNCLDHCFDPVLAIRNCVTVLKPGRSMLGIHHIRVAEKEKYRGLHRWNLEPAASEDDVIISNPETRLSLKEALAGQVREIATRLLDGNRFEFVVTKAGG